MTFLGFDPVVVLNGSNITSTVIDSFTIDVGSEQYADQPQPSILTLQLLDWTITGLTPIEALGKYVALDLYDATNDVTRSMFNGMVNQCAIVPQGNGVYVYEITATSMLSKAMDSLIGGNYPAQTDEERVAAIVAEGWSMAWDDMDTVTTWDDFAATYGDYSWDEFELIVDGYSPVITSGTTFNVIAVDQPNNAYSALYDLVADVRGRFVEDGTGLFYFYDRNTVSANLASPSVTVDCDTMVLDASLGARIGLQELINSVTVTTPTLTSTQTAPDSIKTYGQRPLTIESVLASQSDLDTVAAEIVGTAAEPRTGVTAFAIAAYEAFMTQAEFIALDSALYECQGVELTNVPSVFGGDQTVLLVGARYEYEGGAMTVDYRCQPKSQVMPYQMWDQVDGAYTWNTYLPDVAWDLAD